MQRDVAGDQLVDPIAEAKPAQASRSQDQTVVIAAVQFFQAGDHVPPDVLEDQVGVVVTQLSQAAQGTRAHHRAFGKGVEFVRLVLGVHHQGIGRVFPFGDAAEHQPLRKVGGQVFQGMDGDVRTVHQHLGFQFLGEQAFVADFGQGDVQDLVALGGHGFHRDLQAGMGLLQFRFHPVGLHHGQLAAS